MLLLVSLATFLSACDKQGPMGPPGDPGPDGANGSGSNVLTYQTAEGASITWEGIDGWDGDVLYDLRVNDDESLKLPASVKTYMSGGGAIMVFLQDADTGLWHQLPYLPGAREIYSYQLLVVDDGVPYINISSRVDGDLNNIPIKKIKVIVAPASEKNDMPLQ